MQSCRLGQVIYDGGLRAAVLVFAHRGMAC